MTPLHQAAKHGRAEAVRALIAAGALVESKDVSDHVPSPRPPAILKPHRALRARIGSVPFRINSTRGSFLSCHHLSRSRPHPSRSSPARPLPGSLGLRAGRNPGPDAC